MRLNQRNLAYFASCNSPVDKEGMLMRFSEGKGTYQNKWFVLKGNILFYFDKKGEKEPQGAIILEGCRIELADTKEGLNAFQISFTGESVKIYRLVADSQECMVTWMQVLLCATYDYMRAMVEELQREMDKLTSNDSQYSLVSSGAVASGKSASKPHTEKGNLYSSATLMVKKVSHPNSPLRKAPYSMYDLPRDPKGVTSSFYSELSNDVKSLRSSCFPNPLYDVLDEVSSPTKEEAPPSIFNGTNTNLKKDPKFIIEREYSDSDDSTEESSEQAEYVNVPVKFTDSVRASETSETLSTGDLHSTTHVSTSLGDIMVKSQRSESFLKSTQSNPDLLGSVGKVMGSKLPMSKSDLHLQDPLYANTELRGKAMPPQKPSRSMRQPISMLYENVTNFASDLLVRSNSEGFRSNFNPKIGMLDLPIKATNMIFNRGSSANDLRDNDLGRSIFHDKETRSFPEMHAEFGMLVIQKINEFRQKRTQSSVSE